MRVVHAQAERILAEYKENGVPGYESLEYELGKADDSGNADLTVIGDAHASPEAFAKAAGLLTASAVAPELECLEAPAIIGLPNVGQYVTASAGVWAEPDPERLGDPGVTPSGVVLRWLYDGNEEDPVVIPEGDPHGYGGGLARDLQLPAAAIGKTIQLRVTRGRTTVYSEPFGPVEGGLTEYTFPAQPVPDHNSVSAEPASRRQDGSSSQAGREGARAKTPTTASRAKVAAKVQGADAVSKTGKPDVPKESKKQALAKRAAEEKTPPPAADRTSE